MTAMLLDHTAQLFEEPLYTPLRAIGRVAFPLFCFLLTEGAIHTKNIKKYALRLFLFAIISEIPFDLFRFGKAFSPKGSNVIFTLFLGLISISIWQRLYEKKKTCHTLAISLLISTATFVVVELIKSDYGAFGVALISVLYVLRNFHTERNILSAAILLAYNPFEVWALPSIALFHLYNGEKGRQAKWLFYAFYPLHLIILWLIQTYCQHS